MFSKFGFNTQPKDVEVYGVTPDNVSHTELLDIGTKSHVDIDTHIGAMESMVDQDVRSSASPTFSAVNASTVKSDSYGNLATNGDTHIVTDSATASIWITPHGTGNVIVKGGNTLKASHIASSISNDPVSFSSPIYSTYDIDTDELKVRTGTLDNTKTRIVARDNDGNMTYYRDNIADTSSAQTLTNKTVSTANNTVTVGGTNITSLVGQDVRSIAIPTFAGVKMAATTSNRKVVLYPVADNDHQFYGIGVNSSVLRFQVDSSTSDFVFYSGSGGTTSKEIMRICGSGGIKFIDASASGYTPSPLKHFEEDLVPIINYSGAINVAGGVKYTRIGDRVTLSLLPSLGTFVSASRIYASGVLPPIIRPNGSDVFAPILVTDNGTIQTALGHLFVRTDGSIDIYNSGGTNFAGPGNAGIPYVQSVSYYVS